MLVTLIIISKSISEGTTERYQRTLSWPDNMPLPRTGEFINAQPLKLKVTQVVWRVDLSIPDPPDDEEEFEDLAPRPNVSIVTDYSYQLARTLEAAVSQGLISPVHS